MHVSQESTRFLQGLSISTSYPLRVLLVLPWSSRGTRIAIHAVSYFVLFGLISWSFQELIIGCFLGRLDF